MILHTGDSTLTQSVTVKSLPSVMTIPPSFFPICNPFEGPASPSIPPISHHSRMFSYSIELDSWISNLGTCYCHDNEVVFTSLALALPDALTSANANPFHPSSIHIDFCHFIPYTYIAYRLQSTQPLHITYPFGVLPPGPVTHDVFISYTSRQRELLLNSELYLTVAPVPNNFHLLSDMEKVRIWNHEHKVVGAFRLLFFPAHTLKESFSATSPDLVSEACLLFKDSCTPMCRHHSVHGVHTLEID